MNGVRKSVSVTKNAGRRPVSGATASGNRQAGRPNNRGPQRRGMPPRKKKRIPWLAITLGLTAASMVSATAGALLAVSLSSTPLLQSKLSAKEAAIFNQNGDGSIASGSSLSLPELNRPVNILLLGTKVLTSDLDAESETSQELGYHALVNSFEGLSDTMLLLRFDPGQEKLTLLSVPRDTRANVPGLGQVKINEANLEGGPALAAQSVSDLMNGVGIDRYVRVNVQAIEKLIDAMGGVDVYVPRDMKYQDDSQHLYINLKEGQQTLNGDQALQFLRFRYDNKGDIGRVQRQQMLMRSFIEQTLTPASLTKLPKVLGIVRSHLDTNLSVEELFALVNFASSTQRSDVQMLMVPGNFSDPEEYKASYWLPDYGKLDEIIAQYFDLPIERQPDLWETDYADYDAQYDADYGAAAGGDLGYGTSDYDDAGGRYRSRRDSDPGYRTSDYQASEDGFYAARDLEDAASEHLDLRISIQNSTGEETALNTAYDHLYEEGYDYIFAQEDWSESLPVTRIVAQKGDLEGAKAIRRTLGMGEVVVDSIGDLDSDITVLVGRDWLKKVNRHSTWRDIPTE